MSVRMELSRVLILDSSPEQFITLSEVGGPRSFAIKIGTAEAVAIERRWRGAEPPRPQTHELLDSVVRSLGARPHQALPTLLWDGRFSLVIAMVAGFGRAIAEVGAVMIVGGNIDHVTRVMTTAIALETSKGSLALALGLGIVLLLIAISVNAVVQTARTVAVRRSALA